MFLAALLDSQTCTRLQPGHAWPAKVTRRLIVLALRYGVTRRAFNVYSQVTL